MAHLIELANMSTCSSISFIVPAYNVAPYLDACLLSIVSSCQAGDEIILVNDGSTDDTDLLCRQWAQRYSNLIKLIDQSNQGLSAARNNALQQAKCPYVLFMDSDDVIIPETIQDVRFVLAQHEPDITVMDFCWWTPEGEDVRKRSPSCSHPSRQMSLDRNAFCRETFNDVLFSACSRIFKRELLDQMGPQVFPLGQAYEEISTVPRLTLRARSLYYFDKVLFDYRIRGGSITQSKTAKHCLDLSKALTVSIKEVPALGLDHGVELAANMSAAKLLMTAIRDCGLVLDRPASLYQDTLQLGLAALSLPVDEIYHGLRASRNLSDRKAANHLRFASRLPGMFIATRKLVYGFKRRKLIRHRRND